MPSLEQSSGSSEHSSGSSSFLCQDVPDACLTLRCPAFLKEDERQRGLALPQPFYDSVIVTLSILLGITLICCLVLVVVLYRMRSDMKRARTQSTTTTTVSVVPNGQQQSPSTEETGTGNPSRKMRKQMEKLAKELGEEAPTGLTVAEAAKWMSEKIRASMREGKDEEADGGSASSRRRRRREGYGIDDGEPKKRAQQAVRSRVSDFSEDGGPTRGATAIERARSRRARRMQGGDEHEGQPAAQQPPASPRRRSREAVASVKEGADEDDDEFDASIQW
jgi:hypothetical protein